MLNFLKETANRTYTENGAATPETSGSGCLDLFGTVGALRHSDAAEVRSRFFNAWTEDRNLAMKLLFYARDVRGGLGERQVFRTILAWLAEYAPDSVLKNLAHVPEYGRWDDLLVLFGTPCEQAMLDLVGRQLKADLKALSEGGEVSLLAKWLPSVNASNGETVVKAKRVAKYLGMTDRVYRKTLVKLRTRIRIIENNLREKDYTFDYEKQPSRALFKYRKAFLRNDGDRYADFTCRVRAGQAKLNTGTLYPYEVIAPFFGRSVSNEERAAIDVTWNSLPRFHNGENALVVVDGSGSMYCNSKPRPAEVALSLGIYFAEWNTGAFSNHFITFSRRPRLVEIRGQDIFERVRYCAQFNEVANTDLQKVFDLILTTAAKNRLPQKDLPETLYIISDMEFDACAENAGVSNFEAAKAKYARYGYTLPKVVFWNVDSRNRQQPVAMNEQGVVLVSGCTPRIFSMVASGTLTPYAYMMEVLGGERYREIAA